MDILPIHSNLEGNATGDAAGAPKVGMLPQPSSTAPSASIGLPAGETGFDDGTMSWTQKIREGFLELPEVEIIPSIS
jgi:hypothetical protein